MRDVAFQASGAGGWAGITDKYWLTALIPDQTVPIKMNIRHLDDRTGGDGSGQHPDRYQVDTITQEVTTIAASLFVTSGALPEEH